jgi:hypothetical protein
MGSLTFELILTLSAASHFAMETGYLSRISCTAKAFHIDLLQAARAPECKRLRPLVHDHDGQTALLARVTSQARNDRIAGSLPSAVVNPLHWHPYGQPNSAQCEVDEYERVSRELRQ